MQRTDLLKELRSSSQEELEKRAARLEKELALMVIKSSMKKLENPMKIRSHRREIARIKTLLQR